MLLQKLHDEQMIDTAMDTCEKLRTILLNAKVITEPSDAVDYANAFLLPFKSSLERHSSMFEHTLYAFPEPFPDPFPVRCTADDVVDFYNDMLLALDKDKEYMTLLRSKIYYL
jgi:hypothetical protein